MANILLTRVSTGGQDLTRQIEEAKNKGLDIIKTFEEKKSAGKMMKDRPDLIDCIDYAREGDTIYFDTISRLSRGGVKETLSIMEIIENKGAKWALMEFSGISSETMPLIRDIVVSFLAAIAQEKLREVSRSTKQGQALAWKKGKQKGRPGYDADTESAEMMRERAHRVHRKIKIEGQSWRKVAKAEQIGLGTAKRDIDYVESLKQ